MMDGLQLKILHVHVHVHVHRLLLEGYGQYCPVCSPTVFSNVSIKSDGHV